MRILYGVVGEGMGHATRSRVILEHLSLQGHEVYVVVSGKACRFLQDVFEDDPQVQILEISGLSLAYQKNRASIWRSVLHNLWGAPESLMQNAMAYLEMQLQEFVPEVVISDFESWAYLYALNYRIPLISIDNQQVIARCAHKQSIYREGGLSYLFAKWFTQIKQPRAYHYLTTSFFFPPVKKPKTTLVPPILRPEILAARRTQGRHILVYPSAAMREDILPILQKLPYEFRVYGMNQEKQMGNIQLRPFSQESFIQDFSSARAVIAGGGFSMMSEAVHLQIPMFAIPIQGQFEQEMNARYLRQLGYGEWSFALDARKLDTFIQELPLYERALASYQPRDNTMTLRCLDELLHHVRQQEPAPKTLQSPAMGKFEGALLPEEKAGWQVLS